MEADSAGPRHLPPNTDLVELDDFISDTNTTTPQAKPRPSPSSSSCSSSQADRVPLKARYEYIQNAVLLLPEKPTLLERVRSRISDVLFVLEVLQSLTSLCAVALLTASEYSISPGDNGPAWFGSVWIALASFWCFYVAFHIVIQPDLVDLGLYLINWKTFIDVGTILITLIPIQAIQMLRAARVFRIWPMWIRIVKRVSYLYRNEWMTLGAKAIWTFMTIIYFFALVYSDVENDCSHATAYWECSVPFHSAIYFLITSLTSVGYGDIVPLTHLGRFVTVMVLLILIFLLPFFGGQVIALVQKQDPRNGSLPSIYSGHVLVVGDITFKGVKALVREISYSENKLVTRLVVVLDPSLPSAEMKQLMQKYPDNLLYYCGSPMVKYDLRRMRLRNAAACFIFARAATGDDPHEVDSKNILRALAIRRHHHLIPLFAEALTPSARAHFGLISNCTSICISELSMGLVARSISVPGSNTLIGNLLYSSTFRAVNKSRVPRFTWPWLDRLSHLTRYFKRFRPRPQWAIEYGSGQAKEMYDCLLPKSYSGKTFHEVVRELYIRTDTLLFGLVQDGALLLNPGRDLIVAYPSIGLVCSDTSQVLPVSKSSKKQQYMDSARTPARAPSRIIRRGADNPLESSLSRAFSVENEAVVHRDLSDFIVPQVELQGHLLVCGYTRSLYHLIGTVRSLGKNAALPIVLLLPSGIDPIEWNCVSHFPNLYIIEGDPTLPCDLLRAGITEASIAVVLGGNADRDGDEACMVDASTIVTYILISQLNPTIDMRVELAVSANHNLFVPPTASNPLYDPAIPSRTKSERYHPVQLFPSFAGGTLFTSSVMEALLAQAYQNPFMIPFTKRMIHSDQLQLEPVDPSLIDRCFLDVLDHYTQTRNLLPIGLYRQRTDKRGIQHHYVVTCPPPAERIQELDQVYFLLAHNDVQLLKAHPSSL